MSTSVSYLRKRLKAIGRDDLLSGVERGEFSIHAAAIEAGLIKQPAISGNGSPNRSKAIAMAIWKATRQSPSAAPRGPTLKVSQETATGRPDLAAALAEWEEAQRQPIIDHHVPISKPRFWRGLEPAPTTVPPEPERATHSALPCTSCTHPSAPAALREVFNVYVAARRGEPDLTGSLLPKSCCQRQLRVVDVRCLIG